jgi:hypothetical protein
VCEKVWRILTPLFLLFAAFAQSIDSGEYRARRRSIMEKIPDGIVVLHSASRLKHWEDPFSVKKQVSSYVEQQPTSTISSLPSITERRSVRCARESWFEEREGHYQDYLSRGRAKRLLAERGYSRYDGI